MRAMLPVSVIDIRGPALGETATSMLSYFNLIVYLISNKMLDISEDLFVLLEIALTRGPFLSLLLEKTPTTRAFIQALFESALSLRKTKIFLNLLDAELVFDAWTSQPDVPLELAISERDTALSKCLVRAGADITDDRGSKALAIAAKEGNLELVSFLLEMGANPNPPDTSKCYPALFEATSRDDKEMVRVLLKFGADINASSSRKSYVSPLVSAAENGDLQLIQLLLHHGVHTEDRFLRQQTALGIASDRAYSELARKLLDAGAAVHPPAFIDIQPSYTDSSALYKAVERGHQSVVELLLTHKADPNTRTYHANDPDATGMTVLYIAVTLKNVQIVQLLLEAGARVNEMNHQFDRLFLGSKHRKETALHRAVRTSNTGLVQILLNAGAIAITPFSEVELLSGSQYQDSFLYNTASLLVQYPNSEIAGLLCAADPSAIFKYGTYFFQSAIQSNDIDLAQVFINAGVDVNGVPIGYSREIALHYAVRTGNFELAKVLLDCGTNVNSTSGDGYRSTALKSAIHRGSIELVQMLLSYGANVNPPLGDEYSRTALQHAVLANNLELAQILLDYGADVNAPPVGSYGSTALQSAAEQGNKELVQMLLNHGADVNAPPVGSYGSTALQSAAEQGNKELVQMLLNHGADVNALPVGSYSSTALQSAAEQGNKELVQMLLNHGADVNAPLVGSYGITALQSAAERGNKELVQMLLNHGANVHAPGTMECGSALQSAAEAGHVEVVKLLLHFTKIRDSQANHSSHHLDPDAVSNDWKYTMLPAAAKGGLLDIVRLLLTEGADINTVPPGAQYGTALQEAVGQQDLTMVHLLLDNDADPNIPGPTWVDRVAEWRTGTALQTAVDANNLGLVHILLEAGARADILTSACEDRRTPLEAALEKFEGEDLMMLVQLLLAAGADVNLTGFHNDYLEHGGEGYDVVEKTLLSAAIHSGDVQLVKILIKAGADVNAVSTYEATSHVNAVSTYEEVLERSPLQDAVVLADLEMNIILLEAGADVKVDSPLFYLNESGDIWGKAGMLATAILDGNIELSQLLLDSGANIDSTTQTRNDITALRAAAGMGHISMVETLLKRGAEVDGNPHFVSGTALNCAVFSGHAGIAFTLLEAGADPTLAHSDGGESPLVEAATCGRIDMVQMFLNAIKSRGTSGQIYVELLESSLKMALEHTEGVYTIAMGMIKTEIEDSKSV
jgi:ankyrin repeat protein